jgi:hypothetical protein
MNFAPQRTRPLAHHLASFLIRTGRPEDARHICQELGGRQAQAAQQQRDELAKLLGKPELSTLSDDDLIERIRDVTGRPQP